MRKVSSILYFQIIVCEWEMDLRDAQNCRVAVILIVPVAKNIHETDRDEFSLNQMNVLV